VLVQQPMLFGSNMSLINQMLNELQQSKQASVAINGLVPITDNESKTKKNWLLMLLILLVSAGIVLHFLDQKHSYTDQPINPVDKKLTLGNMNNKTVIEKNVLIYKQQKMNISSLDLQTTLKINIESKAKRKKSLNNDTNQSMIDSTHSFLEKNKLIEKPITQKTVTISDGLKPDKQSLPINTLNNVKQTSKISIAEKELTRLMKYWQLSSPRVGHEKLFSLLDNYPDLPEIWQNALIFIKSKNNHYYEKLLDRSIKTFPQLNNFSYLAAQHYYSTDQYLKAKQQLDFVEENRKDKKIYQLAGLIFQKLGKHQLAIDNYKKLLITTPNLGEINMAVGISFDALNQPKKAASYFSLALKDQQLNPIQKKFVKQQLNTYQG